MLPRILSGTMKYPSVVTAWLSMDAASSRFTWPREREALQHITILLGTGDAGPAEDVLRVV